jgi:flagellar basal body rod protein FlgG
MGVNHPVRFLPEDRLPSVMVDRYTKFGQGALRATGNTLDLAVNGEGFFSVQGAKEPIYTRNGTFSLNKEGVIVDQSGRALLGESGAPIQIPNARGKINVSQDGQVVVDGENAGRIALAKFSPEDAQKLERLGSSAFRPSDPSVRPLAVENPDVRQGYLETADVNAVHTMAMLIKTNRIFELNTRALQAYKAMDEQCAREVGRV